MPVEDRLRRGLEANARAFVPEAEQRLVAVRRRHRARKQLMVTVTVVVSLTALASATLLWNNAGGRSPGAAGQPTQAVTTSSAYAGPWIPDSGWRRVVTRGQLVAAGADSAWLEDNLGDLDRLPITLDFVGRVYSQSQRSGSGWRVGDAGTLDYDGDGRLVLSSTAPGCRGCLMSFQWRIEGDRLRLSGFRGMPEDPISRAIYEGAWTRM